MSEINNPVPEETPADADQVLSLQELDSEEDEVQAHSSTVSLAACCKLN